VPSLFQGGAAFPGNDWILNARGEEYLSRIPAQGHRALARIRAFHLRATQEVLRKLEDHGKVAEGPGFVRLPINALVGAASSSVQLPTRNNRIAPSGVSESQVRGRGPTLPFSTPT